MATASSDQQNRKAVETFTASEWALLKPRSQEWNAAWQRMAEVTGDEDFAAENERSGEVWQYMGTSRHAGVWGHEFRHRDHPMSNRRWVLCVPASPKWAPPPKLKSALSLAGALPGRRAPSPGG